MSSKIDIIVPELPESVTDATVRNWHKKIGDLIEKNEILVDLETDKVIIEIPAPLSGILESLLEKKGSIVRSYQKLGSLCYNKNKDYSHKNIPEYLSPQKLSPQKLSPQKLYKNKFYLSPSIRRIMAKYDLSIEELTEHKNKKNDNKKLYDVKEKRVPMTRLRKRIADRLLEAKNNTAMLTTFNEVNMKPIIDIRKKYGDIFKKKYGIKLGFMSFYVKAVLKGLKLFPEINAYIDGEDIIYHNYVDISISISTHRGLVTPVLKNIDLLTLSEIEKKINILAIKARENKLKIDDLIGGNFTISNGGIFGSLMSTPIINPPQSAILGMHTIQYRPMAVNNNVVILPMMYLALTYDHRLIDGKESISFLVNIKETLENPIKMLLNI